MVTNGRERKSAVRFTFGRTPDRRGGGLAGKATRGLIALQLAAAPLAWVQGGVARLFPAQPTGFVTDAAGPLDAGAVAAMTAKIEWLREAPGAEIAVVTLPTIGGARFEDTAAQGMRSRLPHGLGDLEYLGPRFNRTRTCNDGDLPSADGETIPFSKLILFLGGTLALVLINLYFLFVRRD